jgi:hypothetical protein
VAYTAGKMKKNRITTLVGDRVTIEMSCYDLQKGRLTAADVLIMGRILHNWDLSTKRLLLRKAHEAVPRGGTLIVYDPLIDDERRAEPHGLLSSLNMLIETSGGFEYTGTECVIMHRIWVDGWRIHLTTAIFPHHGATLMLPSTTVGIKGF